jgi:hypothetical protein
MAPRDHPSRQRRETFVGYLLTLLFGAALLLFLIFVTGGFFLNILAALAAIGAVGYLHYLLWGHSLTQAVAGEREEEEARERWEEGQAAADPGRPPGRF